MSHKIFSASVIATILLLLSCKKHDEIEKGAYLAVQFSHDTIVFDTVFTSLGSTTKTLMIYNKSSKPIQVNKIKLSRGLKSPFRINIDGLAVTEMNNIEIEGNDSLFVFVKVTIDPNNNSLPLIETDSIEFITNGNYQNVKLVAWGQDAYFYNKVIIASDYIFKSDKPHVIYNMLAIDSLYTLNVEAGTKIYMHHNATILVYRDATIKMNGTKEKPILIQGDRLENFYHDIQAQWNKIWLYAGSINNEINYAIIKNGTIGIQIDTLGNSTNPTLRIANTIINNMSETAMLCQGTKIEAANCVFGISGTYSLAIRYGGSYDFRNCTFANFTGYSKPAVLINNYYKDITGAFQIRPLEKAFFGNCIIYGPLKDEIEIDKHIDSEIFNYKFDHCLLKTNIDITNNQYFENCIKNEDPWIRGYEKGLFKPDSAASATIDKGSINIVNNSWIDITLDVDGNSRIIDSAPDIGAYEFKGNRKRQWK